jgi:hypothetical protein
MFPFVPSFFPSCMQFSLLLFLIFISWYDVFVYSKKSRKIEGKKCSWEDGKTIRKKHYANEKHEKLFYVHEAKENAFPLQLPKA